MEIELEISQPKKFVSIKIEAGLISKALLNIDAPIAIISDENVSTLYAEPLIKKLSNKADLFTFPPGEKSKSYQTAFDIHQKLLKANFGRDSVIIAIGGGVVCDLAAFVASTYARGVKLILIPTSLLAMVDAAIGGKTAVNLPNCKNYVGTFYQPESIIIDPELLLTQPDDSYRLGLVEMVKHGLIYDSNHFDWIVENIEKLLSKDLFTLTKGIRDSCKIKLEIVQKDPHEQGIRSLLNFGHTIGHAIEAESDFEISHGKAVAFGILVEAHLSNLAESEILRLYALFNKIGFSFADIGSVNN